LIEKVHHAELMHYALELAVVAAVAGFDEGARLVI
jgi:hypothetical protein